MPTKTSENVIETSITVTGGAAALSPGMRFYETPEWIGIVAIIGVTALAVQLIRGLYGLSRDIKRNKERRK